MSPDEIVRLTLDFYKRNYIEGLFLSSGIIRSADYTMEQIIEVAKELRETHQFKGYIHLKTIPEASKELIEIAGRYADRISINIELPKESSIQKLAPEKSLSRTRAAMGSIRSKIDEGQYEGSNRRRTRSVKAPGFATGQSTQMIIGADDSDDTDILAQSTSLYKDYRLKRVYYSAFSPIPSASTILPLKAPPLVREHRLYQADWLMRFYGFSASELTTKSSDSSSGRNLDLNIDPKLSWALRNTDSFPVDVNKATKEQLLRIPGIGVRNVQRILSIRRWTAIRLEDLAKIRVNLRKCIDFIVTSDHKPRTNLDSDKLKLRFRPKPKQAEFNFSEIVAPTLFGEI